MDSNNNTFQEMQMVEQSLQNILYQKQAFQMELSETESALTEIEKSGDEVFKIVGQLMIKSDKIKIKKELKDKQKIIQTRLNAMDSQEKTLTKELETLRNEIFKSQTKKK
ncbi:prefoldin subunit [Candidatus Pacearchaeota archaeon]|nr:prefoldin subunit [Candidatus Pacearchaeota archaeon]